MFSIQYSEDPKKRRAEKIFLYTVGGAFLFVAFCLVVGLLIQFLWNATIASAFSLPAISYWQAIGLFILAKFFFGFGMTSGSGSSGRTRKKDEDRGHAESPDMEDLAKDESFKKYWQEEGRAAFEAFIQAREAGPNEAPEES
jgi:hypothetical protein